MTSDVLPGTGKPGGSAQERYEQMAKSWRSTPRMRRIRRICLSLGVVFAGVGVWTGDALAFNVGAFAGTSFCFWFGVRDLAVPDYIERWRRGAEGEKWTAKELCKLGPDWRVRHDLQGRYGNVDHVVVGPAGVFLLDSKAWFNGVTSINADGPVVTPRHDAESSWHWSGLPGRMRGAAAGASGGLRAMCGRRLKVTPVVVIWGEFPGRVQERGGVTYVEGEHVRKWLLGLPHRLSPEDNAALARLY